MTNEGKWTIVVGCDDAGVAYKDQLKADLEKDPRVARVIDVGVPHDGDKTAYPHVAVDAARKVAKGEADRALLICGTGESAVCSLREAQSARSAGASSRTGGEASETSETSPVRSQVSKSQKDEKEEGAGRSPVHQTGIDWRRDTPTLRMNPR